MSMMYVAAATVAVSAFSSYRQGQAMEAGYKAQGDAANYNALIQRQQAEETYAAANAREEQKRVSNRIDEGKRAAAVAESGLGTGGSNSDFERQQSVLSELDALNIRYEGALEATGLTNRAVGTAWEGDVARSNQSFARGSTYLGAASSALSTASRFYGGGSR